MTKEQKQMAYEIGEEIRMLPGGSRVKVYASMETVRLQDTQDNVIYRMFTPCMRDNRKVLRVKMLNLFREMAQEAERKEETNNVGR